MTLLRNDPWLTGRLRFLLSYDGEVLDDADPDDIPRPFLRVKLRPGASGWFAAGQHRFPVQFQLEMAVDGTRLEPLEIVAPRPHGPLAAAHGAGGNLTCSRS